MITTEQIAKVVERAESNVVQYKCWACWDGKPGPFGDTTGGRIMRDITLEWEHEYGDFGSVLSTYPVFAVQPPCDGVTPHYDFSDEDRVPETCPFHEANDNEREEREEVLSIWRERNAFAKLLGVKNRA